MSNCKSFFSGYESRDSNCNSFNNRTMFEQFNGFNGFKRDSFDGVRDRHFQYAKGRGSLTPLGGTAPARAVAAGDDVCDQPKCGNMGGVYRRCRKNGCTCTDMSVPNGQCVSEKSRRGQIGIAQQKKMGLRDASGRKVNLTPQQVAAREVADPTGYGCEDISCGSYSGGGRKRCPKGCKCKGGWCVSKNRREHQGGVTPAARQGVIGGCPDPCKPCHNGVGCCEAEGGYTKPCGSGARKRKVQGGGTSSDFFICPKGKCWGGKNCVPCTDGTPNAAFSGRDMSNGGFRLR